MRIVYFHQYFSTPKGKAGIRSYYFAKKLVKEGHEVIIICLNDARTDCGLKSNFKNNLRQGIFEGIKIVQLNINYSNSINLFNRSIIFLKYSLNSISLAFKLKPNLIIATSTPLTVAIPGIILRWIFGVPFIFEVRDLWPKGPIAMGILKNKFIILLLKILENVSYKSADSLIGLAPGICNEILNKKISEEKVNFIPNISDMNLFNKKRKINKKRPELLSKYDSSINRSTLITAFTGAHGLTNGLDNLLKVAKILKAMNREDIKILFVGEGISKNELKKKAKTNSLNNCIFIDSMPKEKLAKMLNESVHLGLMVLQNIPEFYNSTSPNKFFDYLACGLPVINNYPGWLSEIIEEKELGFYVGPDNHKLFAQKLIEIADNKEVLLKLSRNCIKYAENFNQELLSNKFSLIVKKTFIENKDRQFRYLLKKIYFFFKSLIDRVIALILIITLSPLLIIISIIVFLKLGYPIFFIQDRPGLNNKIFKIIKFRSMKNTENFNCNVGEDSLRINKFGKIFRSTSLDELPELFNILKGDMSFVGPRPLLKEYLKLYSKEELKRHYVKPGITGLAQIKGRNLITWSEKFKFDLFYVKNINPILDLKILLITILKVIIRDGINSKDSVTTEKFKGEKN